MTAMTAPAPSRRIAEPHGKRGAPPTAGAPREAETLRLLRRRIARIERPAPEAARDRVLPLGLAALDRRLPGGGLPLGVLHEVAGDGGDGAATAFLAALLGRLTRRRPGAVLWCARGESLYGPGLAAFGLDPGRLVLVRGRSEKELLWAMEEGLRAKALAAVVGEVRRPGLTRSRRLLLAAEAGGTTAFLLRPVEVADDPSAAVTRWRIAPLPSAPVRGPDSPSLSATADEDRPRWRAALVRCRGGAPAVWTLEWNDETHGLALAADACDRSPGFRPADPGEAGSGKDGRPGEPRRVGAAR